MKTQGVVIADDPVYLNWLQNGVGGAADFSRVRAANTEDLVERLANLGQVDVAFFEFSAGNYESRARLVEGFLERFPDVPVIGLGSDNAQDVVLAAMRSGARDFFVLQRDDEQLPGLLSKVLRRSLSGGGRQGQAAQGRLVSLFSATAYEGLAFAAEHLALNLMRQRPDNERSLFVDLSAPPGAGAVFLNLHPAYSLLDAVQDVYRCDQTLIDTAFARHGSGLYVLSLPEEQLGYPGFDAEELVKLLEVLRSLFSSVVVSLDAHAGLSMLAGVIGLSDHGFLITDQSILKSRHSKYLLRELRLGEVSLNHVRLVVDNYQRRLGLEAENLSQLLELSLAGTLSGAPANRVQAMNAGEPMADFAPRDPYVREVEALAAQIQEGAARAADSERGGLLARMLGRS